MHWYGFISFKIGATLGWDIDNGGDYVCGEAGNVREISTPSAHFCWESITVVKVIVLKIR